jgi:hypothetical protein
MTKLEYETLIGNENTALRTLQYLSTLYYTLKDLLNFDKLPKNRKPVKLEYTYKDYDVKKLVKFTPNAVKSFEINVWGGYGAPEDWVYKAFPGGAGWMNVYPIEQLPEILKITKGLIKQANKRFTEAEKAADVARYICFNGEGLKEDPVTDIKNLINYSSIPSNRKEDIKKYLKSHGIEF